MTTRSEVKAELQAILISERSQRWKDSAWDRAIDAALRALSDSRPLTAQGQLSLELGQRRYLVGDDVLEYFSCDWGLSPAYRPWDLGYPGVVPRVYLIRTLAGKQLEFATPPTSQLLAAYGCDFSYRYKQLHRLTEDVCTLLAEDMSLLVTRALAELMKDLMAANVTQPIQLSRGVNAIALPSNATPSAVYEALMKAYREAL